MPVTWRIERSAVVITAVGDYAVHEFHHAIEEALTSPEFTPGMALLIDGRSSLEYSPDAELRERAERLAALRARGLAGMCAIVTRDEPLHLMLMRVIGDRLEQLGMQTAMFTDIDPAWRWLGQASPGG